MRTLPPPASHFISMQYEYHGDGGRISASFQTLVSVERVDTSLKRRFAR